MNRKKYQLKSTTNKHFNSPTSSNNGDGTSVYSKHSANCGSLILQEEKSSLNISKNNFNKILNQKSKIYYSSKNFEKKTDLGKFSTTTKNSKIPNKQNKIRLSKIDKKIFISSDGQKILLKISKYNFFLIEPGNDI